MDKMKKGPEARPAAGAAAAEKETKKTTAVKKPPARTAAPKKAAVKKPAAEKTASGKIAAKSAANNTAAKKTAEKKTTARKTTAKKTAAARPAAAGKTAAKKPAVKKAAPKKPAAPKKASQAASMPKKRAAKPAVTKAAPASKPEPKKAAAPKPEPKKAAAPKPAPEPTAAAQAPEPTAAAQAPKAAPEPKAPAPAPKPAPAPDEKKPAKAEPERRILMAASECVPFASTGGLGEVIGSLPAALNEVSGGKTECRVIMPLYADIPEEYRKEMKFLGCDYVRLAWRSLYMGVFELVRGGVTYYFIDNEYYFGRGGLYGYYDDGERFAFFSRAVLDSQSITGFVPDIIHANDWETALIPVLQNSLYRREFLKTVFSIHNIEYQGYYPTDFDTYVIGLPESERYVIEFGDAINLMKGGIESANLLCTVSPTYAEELKNPLTAYGLDEIIRRNAHKLHGVLNGIDTKAYDPSTDPKIAENYSSSDLSGKKQCKKALQRELALDERDVPVITMVSRLVPSKGLELVREVIDGVLDNFDVQFVLLGTGYPEFEGYFHDLEARRRDKARCIINFNADQSHRVYAAGDILLMPSVTEPCGLSQMIGCRYGDIPVVRATGGLRDSIKDCTLGDGSGFVFENYDADSFYHAIENAVTRYYDRENWEALVKHDLDLDFGWGRSAKNYLELYDTLND
ncbi:MAG: glycogen synthase [Anaerovoracaceae bacterium]|jgi:starch synthase